MADVVERELLVALEGERRPRALNVMADVTAARLLERARESTGRDDLTEVLIEDEEIVLDGDVVIFERISVEEFKLVHVATHGDIVVTVVFNGSKEAAFKPSATMAKIIAWAMKAFGLTGDASDFQLKLGDQILAAGEHLGQIANGAKAVRLSLVMKIKPQG